MLCVCETCVHVKYVGGYLPTYMCGGVREGLMWMEEQIREGDGVTRRKAQDILRPRETEMRYVVALLRGEGKHDVMGRKAGE